MWHRFRPTLHRFRPMGPKYRHMWHRFRPMWPSFQPMWQSHCDLYLDPFDLDSDHCDLDLDPCDLDIDHLDLDLEQFDLDSYSWVQADLQINFFYTNWILINKNYPKTCVIFGNTKFASKWLEWQYTLKYTEINKIPLNTLIIYQNNL